MSKNTGGFIGQDGIKAPDPATGVSGASGEEQVVVSFTAPENVGGSAITGYRAQSNDGIGSSGSASPITVSGLTGATSYTFNVWAINAFGWSSPSDASAAVVPSVAVVAMGLFAGAYPSSGSSTIDQITFSSLGNATSTGSLSYQRGWAAQGSGTRAVFAGASDSGGSGVNTVIEYVTFGTAGNGTDFGDLTVARWNPSSVGNSTRGVWASGSPSSGRSNVMDYITFATTGNATDFGDIATQTSSPAGLSSPTRGVIKAGFGGSNPYWINAIDYITTATTGNSTDFGDTTYLSYNPGGASSDTRGLIVGGMDTNSALTNVIDYITIATTGNASDFGDLAEARRLQSSGSSNNILAVFGGGYSLNSLEKITIATLGNGIDFGDLTQTGFYGGCSNAHGGLQ